MKKLIKAGLVFGLLLLVAGNVWALPMAGDTVKMTTNPGEHYGMTITASGDFYNTFCVEKDEYFTPGQEYLVDSVTNYANEGGIGFANIGGDDLGVSDVTSDFISQKSLWLYASYFDGKLGTRSDTLAAKVQNAIWYMENEISNSTDWDIFSSGITNFGVNGWDIKVVNLSQNGTLKQSQLVGAPVPEPATMVLFGIGLLGLAGIGRKRTQR